MKNVYDILVNFKKNPYEFYEWEITDEINHIKKIPSFKVNNATLYEMMNYDVNVSREFLETILDKTEIFCNRMIKKIKHACILFNEEFCIALAFDSTGKTIGKSKLLFDESDDIVVSGRGLDVTSIKYNVLSKKHVNSKFTRKENKVMTLLINYLDKVYESKKSDELKYMYFECFNEEVSEYENAYLKLKQSILNADFDVTQKLKSLIKALKK